MSIQPTFIRKQVMQNGEVMLTNTTITIKSTTREKTWAGDFSVFPLKKFYIDYQIQFQSDGSIACNLVANTGDSVFNISTTGINWWYVETSDILLEPLDVTTDETPYFFLSGNKLVFISNPTIPTIQNKGSWQLTLLNVDPSSTTGLWVSNEDLPLFDMKFYFNIDDSYDIPYFDSIDNEFLVTDSRARVVEQRAFVFEGLRQAYTKFNMLLGTTPPWTFSTQAESIAYFTQNKDMLTRALQQSKNTTKNNSLESEVDGSLSMGLTEAIKMMPTTNTITFEQLQKNIIAMNPGLKTNKPCGGCNK